jgi:excisionase family DNA binding protein
LNVYTLGVVSCILRGTLFSTFQDMDELITTNEAAKMLKVSAHRVRQLIHDGSIPIAVKIGRIYLVNKRDVEKAKDRQRVGRPKKKRKGAKK